MPNGTRITALWLSTSDCENSVCGDFYITTDGGTQSEMKNGQTYNRPQTFVFTILKDRIGTYNVSQSALEDFCINGNNDSKCTGWVLKNGNMDYLHCDDLDINTKIKCD